MDGTSLHQVVNWLEDKKPRIHKTFIAVDCVCLVLLFVYIISNTSTCFSWVLIPETINRILEIVSIFCARGDPPKMFSLFQVLLSSAALLSCPPPASLSSSPAYTAFCLFCTLFTFQSIFLVYLGLDWRWVFLCCCAGVYPPPPSSSSSLGTDGTNMHDEITRTLDPWQDSTYLIMMQTDGSAVLATPVRKEPTTSTLTLTAVL